MAAQEHFIPDILHAVEPDAALPLIFDSPHSGLTFPADFSCNATPWQLRMNTDLDVDALFAHVTGQGAGLLKALFPRTFVDPNRGEGELDPAMLAELWPDPVLNTDKVRAGMGVIRRFIVAGVAMYDDPLSLAEVRHRLEVYHQPYHARLQAMADAAHARAGAVWCVNCHSTKSVGAAMNRDQGSTRADIILSDREGETTEPAFLNTVAAAFRDRGYWVEINKPFKGAEIVRRHGRPHEGRHALQIEINRALYLDETNYERIPRFEDLRRDLTEITALMAAFVRARTAPG